MMTATVQIHSDVPFGHNLYTRLKLADIPLERFIRHTRRESNFLAWETVRQQTNPYFSKGTGFEGYLIGRCPTADAALAELIEMSQTILERIARLYRFQYGFRSNLMKTLTKEQADERSIQIWSNLFGAELGRLRAKILTDRQAQDFRHKTYQVVNQLPPIKYQPHAEDIGQEYCIGADRAGHGHKLNITCSLLPPKQQDAWLVAENIGEFGHPLVRQFLEERLV